MSECRYSISDAARLAEVKSHVLRYWEEELKLPINRNEMGHRYYTQLDIQLFFSIRELKKKGLQLKEIAELVPLFYEKAKPEEVKPAVKVKAKRKVNTVKKDKIEIIEEIKAIDVIEIAEDIKIIDEVQSIEEVQNIEVVENIKAVESIEEIAESVPVIPEQFFAVLEKLVMARKKETQVGEERFKRLDEAIRKQQQTRKLIAVTQEQGKKRKRTTPIKKSRKTVI